MKNPTSPKIESVLALFKALPPKEKEIFFQHLVHERSVPQWQIELVRQRKRDANDGQISWVEGPDFLKSLG